MKRKFLSALLMAAMAVSLITGCGNNGERSEERRVGKECM